MKKYALKIFDSDNTYRVSTHRVTIAEETGERIVLKSYLPLISSVDEPSSDISISGQPSISSIPVEIYDSNRNISSIFEQNNYQDFIGEFYFLDENEDVKSTYKGYITDVSKSDSIISFSIRANIDYNDNYLPKFKADTFQDFEMRSPEEVSVGPYVTEENEMGWEVADAVADTTGDYNFYFCDNSVEHDGSGNIHMAFLESTNNALFYRNIKPDKPYNLESDLSFISQRDRADIDENLIYIGGENDRLTNIVDLVIDGNGNPWIAYHRYDEGLLVISSRTANQNTDWEIRKEIGIDFTLDVFTASNDPVVGEYSYISDHHFDLFTSSGDVYVAYVSNVDKGTKIDTELTVDKILDNSKSNTIILNSNFSNSPSFGYHCPKFSAISDSTGIYFGLQVAELNDYGRKNVDNYTEYYLKLDLSNLSVQSINLLNSRSAYSRDDLFFSSRHYKSLVEPSVDLCFQPDGEVHLVFHSLKIWSKTQGGKLFVYSTASSSFDQIEITGTYFETELNLSNSFSPFQFSYKFDISISSSSNGTFHLLFQYIFGRTSRPVRGDDFINVLAYNLFSFSSSYDLLGTTDKFSKKITNSNVSKDIQLIDPTIHFDMSVNDQNVPFICYNGGGSYLGKYGIINEVDYYEDRWFNSRPCCATFLENKSDISGTDDISLSSGNKLSWSSNTHSFSTTLNYGDKLVIYDQSNNIQDFLTYRGSPSNSEVYIIDDISSGYNNVNYYFYKLERTDSFSDDSIKYNGNEGFFRGLTISGIRDYSNFISFSNVENRIEVEVDEVVKAVSQKSKRVFDFNISSKFPNWTPRSQRLGGVERGNTDLSPDWSVLYIKLSPGNDSRIIKYNSEFGRLETKTSRQLLFNGPRSPLTGSSASSLPPDYDINRILDEVLPNIGVASSFDDIVNYAILGSSGLEYHKIIAYLFWDQRDVSSFNNYEWGKLRGDRNFPYDKVLNLYAPLVLDKNVIKLDLISGVLASDWGLSDLDKEHWRVAKYKDFGISGEGNIVDNNYRIRPLKEDNKDEVYINTNGELLSGEDDLGFVSFGDKFNVNDYNFSFEGNVSEGFKQNKFKKIHRIKFYDAIESSSGGKVNATDTNVGKLEVHDASVNEDIDYSFHKWAIKEPWASFSIPKVSFFEDNFNYESGGDEEPNKIEFLEVGFVAKNVVLSVNSLSRDNYSEEDLSKIKDKFRNRLKGERIDLIREKDDFNRAKLNQQELQSKLINKSSSKFAVVTLSEIESIDVSGNNVRLLERVYFNVPDAYKIPIEAARVPKSDEDKGTTDVEVAKSDAGKKVRDNYTNNLVFNPDFSVNNINKIFSVDGAEVFFLSSVYRLIKNKVPGEGEFLGDFFPVSYGFLDKVPLMHVIGQYVDSESKWTAGGDVYVYSLNDTGVKNANNIDLYLDESGDYSIEGSENLGINYIESPFPKYIEDHYERNVFYDNNIAEAEILKSPITNPYHKLIKKDIGQNYVNCVQLRGKEWDSDLSSLDARYPIRNGIGKTGLYASFKGVIDTNGDYVGEGEVISHPLDAIHHFLDNYGREPFDGSVIDEKNIEKIKGKTPKHVVGVYIQKNKSPLQLISEICNQFGYVFTYYKGKLIFNKLDFEDILWDKPISDDINILSGVEENDRGYSNIYTSIDYRYNRNYMGGDFNNNILLDDSNNKFCQRASRVKDQSNQLVVEAKHVNSDAVAREVVQRLVKFNCSRKIELNLQIRETDTEFIPGQFVPMTHSPLDIRNEPILIKSVDPSIDIIDMTVLRFPNIFDTDVNLFETIDNYSQQSSSVNFAPVSDAGDDKQNISETTYQLDGTGSYDPSGDALTYDWSIVTKPSGASNTITNSNSAIAQINVDDDSGDWVIELEVSNGSMSDIDRVKLLT